MCSLCDSCGNYKYMKGVCRGVMDCDPPEIYCSKDEWLFYIDDKEAKAEIIDDLIANGKKLEEIDENDIKITCPYYWYVSYDEDY